MADASLCIQVSNSMPDTDTDQVMSDQSQVSAFKQMWLGLRDQATCASTAAASSVQSISDICAAQGSILDYFYEAACTIDPSVQGMDHFAVAQQAVANPSSAIGQLWAANFADQYNQYETQVSTHQSNIADQKTQIAATQNQISNLKQNYTKFAASAPSTVPSPEDLESDVTAGDALYQASPTNSTTVDSQVISDLSDSTNALITAGTTAVDSDLNDTQGAPIDLTALAPTAPPPQPQINPFTVGVGALALAYLLWG